MGQAANGLEALQQVRQLQPELVLMDIRMPVCGGLEATRLIKTEMPSAKVVVLTVSEDEDDLFEAIKSGAEGYILKNVKGDEFGELITGIARGDAPIHRHLATKLLQEFARQAVRTTTPAADELTARELDVLRMVASGRTNKEVAQDLLIGAETVKTHLKNIMQKLHLRNRAQVIAYALRRGIVPRDGE